MKKLLLLLLIAPVIGLSQKVDIQPEIKLCDYVTSYLNSKHYEDKLESSGRPEYKLQAIWGILFKNNSQSEDLLLSIYDNDKLMYGENFYVLEGEDPWDRGAGTFNSLFAKNCEAYKKLLTDLEIDPEIYDLHGDIIKML